MVNGTAEGRMAPDARPAAELKMRCGGTVIGWGRHEALAVEQADMLRATSGELTQVRRGQDHAATMDGAGARGPLVYTRPGAGPGSVASSCGPVGHGDGGL